MVVSRKSKLTWLFVDIKNSVTEAHPQKVHMHNYLSLTNYNDYIAMLN